jgi:hypothetical protein
MAENREEFDYRLAALGDLVSEERVRFVTRASLQAIKMALDEAQAAEFVKLLPQWLRMEWDGLPFRPGNSGEADLIDMLQGIGDYPYRAGAEHDLTYFLAALRESLPEGGDLYMRPLLPEANRELFDFAGSCAYDASVKEFV